MRSPSTGATCESGGGLPTAISLQTTIANNHEDDESNDTFEDIICDEGAEDERGELVKERAFAALNQLTGRERDLFERRYLIEEGRQSFAALAPKFKLSRESLRRINTDSLDKVRANFLRRTPLFCRLPSFTADRDAWNFIDEFWCYRQRGIGYLRRRQSPGGRQPRWRADLIWHVDCCPIGIPFTKEQIAAFVAVRPDVLAVDRPSTMPEWRWRSVFYAIHSTQTKSMERANRPGLEDGLRTYRTTSAHLDQRMDDPDTIFAWFEQLLC